MKQLLLALLALLFSAYSGAQDVSIEFVTPSIVHIVKGTPTKSLTVICPKQDVPLKQSGNTLSSSELSVRLDKATGCVTFLSRKGKVLLREKSMSLTRRNQDEWEVSQTFQLDKDEAVYGLGTIQNGKMNRRGEKKRMEQSNLEDFQNVLQSIMGWGIYW